MNAAPTDQAAFDWLENRAWEIRVERDPQKGDKFTVIWDHAQDGRMTEYVGRTLRQAVHGAMWVNSQPVLEREA